LTFYAEVILPKEVLFLLKQNKILPKQILFLLQQILYLSKQIFA